MTEYPLFSIIIAAYNVQDYLHEAVDSLIKQNFNFNKIEIILVDDGSTDNTSVICDSYQKNILRMYS